LSIERRDGAPRLGVPGATGDAIPFEPDERTPLDTQPPRLFYGSRPMERWLSG
jgi:hypothetical protein